MEYREAIRSDYTQNLEWLEREVVRSLENALNDVRKEFQRQFRNISPPKPADCRIKGFAKIIEKLGANDEDWEYAALFVRKAESKVTAVVNDLVGGRLVCATPSDVDKVVQIISSWSKRFTILKSEMVHIPESGYRAYHIDAQIAVCLRDETLFFPVEIQVKTLLQDAWANFGHDEFYKPEGPPPEISLQISRHLADTLASLDQIGQIIRDEKLRKRPAPSSLDPAETLVTSRTLSYLVSEAFSIELTDVELQRCVSQLKAFGHDSIAAASALMRDEKLVAVIEVAKAKAGIPIKPSPFEILYFGPLAAKEGEIAVIQELRRMYGLTELLCNVCQKPISKKQKQFIDAKTDFDLIYYCEDCSGSRLKKCETCDLLTETKQCKNCTASSSSSDII